MNTPERTASLSAAQITAETLRVDPLHPGTARLADALESEAAEVEPCAVVAPKRSPAADPKTTP